MSDIEIVVRLPEELVERAKAKGVLNNARIALLLQAELERIESWYTLDQSLEPAREAFHKEHTNMSEDDVMAMINDLVDEVRREDDEDESSTV